ncbi:hypothetical protein BAXH7_03383 [Bacillus amyloliquefaciens XH7]|nr:hypothetical protein BAXH7_03383 [Bacillus amyloliquefaciens XH7]QBG57721.1 hypothetical protein D2M30_3421 [Bacillus amyloliquefaciens]
MLKWCQFTQSDLLWKMRERPFSISLSAHFCRKAFLLQRNPEDFLE